MLPDGIAALRGRLGDPPLVGPHPAPRRRSADRRGDADVRRRPAAPRPPPPRRTSAGSTSAGRGASRRSSTTGSSRCSSASAACVSDRVGPAPGRRASTAAARERGITLQWCMGTPADFAQTTTLTQVTSVRTCGDHGYIATPGQLWAWFCVTNALARPLGLAAVQGRVPHRPRGGRRQRRARGAAVGAVHRAGRPRRPGRTLRRRAGDAHLPRRWPADQAGRADRRDRPLAVREPRVRRRPPRRRVPLRRTRPAGGATCSPPTPARPTPASRTRSRSPTWARARRSATSSCGTARAQTATPLDAERPMAGRAGTRGVGLAGARAGATRRPRGHRRRVQVRDRRRRPPRGEVARRWGADRRARGRRTGDGHGLVAQCAPGHRCRGTSRRTTRAPGSGRFRSTCRAVAGPASTCASEADLARSPPLPTTHRPRPSAAEPAHSTRPRSGDVERGDEPVGIFDGHRGAPAPCACCGATPGHVRCRAGRARCARSPTTTRSPARCHATRAHPNR